MSVLVKLTGKLVKNVLLVPILIYRYMISPFLPGACRHIPSCSQYASDAIELNGGWKGSWLGLSRLLRCHPWGSQGLDPAPDLRHEQHPIYLSWRYGRWNGAHISERFDERKKGAHKCPDCDP